MKNILLFAFSCSLLLTGWASTACCQSNLSQNFNGFVSQNSTLFYFSSHDKNNQAYTIETNTTDVQDSLNLLSEGDYITGTGSVDATNKILHIDSIEYVGLHRLLGPWSSSEGLMVFKDFSTMKFFPMNGDQPQDDASFDPEDFRYSLSPNSTNGDWILFLSDDKSTTFATVEFDSDKINLKIFDSESGNILRTLVLERP